MRVKPLPLSVFYTTLVLTIKLEKYMMARLGLLPSPELRLPLVPLDATREHVLDGVLERSGLLHAAAQPAGRA